MNKKATSILMMIFELIVVIFVIYMSFEVARRYGSSENTNKINLANDFKMMIDTLVSVPGEATVEYSGDVSKYSFILNSNQIMVLIKGEDQIRMVSKTFFLPAGYQAEGALEGTAKACLFKQKKRIILKPCA